MFVKIAKQLAAEIDPPDPVGQFLKTNILPISLVETMIQFSEPHRIAPFLKTRRTINSRGYSQETTAGEYSLSDLTWTLAGVRLPSALCGRKVLYSLTKALSFFCSREPLAAGGLAASAFSSRCIRS